MNQKTTETTPSILRDFLLADGADERKFAAVSFSPLKYLFKIKEGEKMTIPLTLATANTIKNCVSNLRNAGYIISAEYTADEAIIERAK